MKIMKLEPYENFIKDTILPNQLSKYYCKKLTLIWRFLQCMRLPGFPLCMFNWNLELEPSKYMHRISSLLEIKPYGN